MSKEEVQRLLEGRQYDGLMRLAGKDQEVIRYLFAFLENREGLLRWRAIEGLGHVAAGLSRTDPESGREIIRQLLWLLSEESDGFGWSTPEAIGEIIRNQPGLFAEFLPTIVSSYDDARLRRGVIWSLGRIGKRQQKLVASARPLLLEALKDSDPEIRGFAAWSLGEIAAQEAASTLGDLRSDHESVTIYEAGKLWQRTVGEVALDALANIRARS